MSVNYRAIAGYGFFSTVLDTDWSDPSTHGLRDQIWNMLSQQIREYYGGKDYLFDEEFNHEILEEALKTAYPDIQVVWYGNPYFSNRSDDKLFFTVKSTLVEEGGDNPVSLKQHSFIPAAVRQQLADVADLLGVTKEPQWYVWMQVS